MAQGAAAPSQGFPKVQEIDPLLCTPSAAPRCASSLGGGRTSERLGLLAVGVEVLEDATQRGARDEIRIEPPHSWQSRGSTS
jgi:hypothetical protein